MLEKILESKQSSNPKLFDPTPRTKSLPVQTKKTVFYIVSTVVFSPDFKKVVLVQESKAICRGKWYLPAGRLEPNEDLITGAKRELYEEAGIHVDLLTLAQVQENGVEWIRFCFVGVQKGNDKLKNKPDEETLQAAWVPLKELFKSSIDYKVAGAKLVLRAKDILPIIRDSLTVQKDLLKNKKFNIVLPSNKVSFPNISIRLVVTCNDFFMGTKDKQVLLPEFNLYVSRIGEGKSVQDKVAEVMDGLLPDAGALRCDGILAVHHSGYDAVDGMRFDVVYCVDQEAKFSEKILPKISGSRFMWHKMEAKDKITQVLFTKGMCLVPFSTIG